MVGGGWLVGGLMIVHYLISILNLALSIDHYPIIFIPNQENHGLCPDVLVGTDSPRMNWFSGLVRLREISRTSVRG